MAAQVNINYIDEANDVALDLAKIMYKSQFNALSSTLNRFHVPEWVYSLFEVKDEHTCLIYEEGEWKVFFSERNNRTNEKDSNNPEEACQNLLYAMADSMEEYQQMSRYYQGEMKRNPMSGLSSSDIYKTVREGFRKLASSAAIL